MKPPPMLYLEDIHVRIGKATLLRGVTMDVTPGTLTVVLGPNGAGKSTLLRVASGERTPTQGKVTMDGASLDHARPDTLALRRAVLPQESTLTFPFTAFEVALLGRTPHARHSTPAHDRAAVHRALARAEVSHLSERLYPTLSGGEKQRVHLARVLAQLDGAPSPSYLFLDEPTSSLDLRHQHSVLQSARALTAEGVGVLAVLHDLNLAAQYADHLVLLKQGQVLAQGPPAEVLEPETLREAFGVSVVILSHPGLDCPLVVPVPEGVLTPVASFGADV